VLTDLRSTAWRTIIFKGERSTGARVDLKSDEIVPGVVEYSYDDLAVDIELPVVLVILAASKLPSASKAARILKIFETFLRCYIVTTAGSHTVIGLC
jgi:hypothetical protein